MPVPSSISYRWIRRPNELAVVLELAALSLLHGAGLAALLGGLAHRWVLQLAALQETPVHPVGRGTAEPLVWLVSDWLWKLLRAKK